MCYAGRATRRLFHIRGGGGVHTYTLHTGYMTQVRVDLKMLLKLIKLNRPEFWLINDDDGSESASWPVARDLYFSRHTLQCTRTRDPLSMRCLVIKQPEA